MKKILCSIIVILISGFMIYTYCKKNYNNENYIAEEMSINDEEYITNNLKIPEEEELSSFSTKLPKDTKARKSNIDLACKTINKTIVKSGEIFSLWDILGEPTKQKGYKKAKTFTSNGKVKNSYGGGICQVSTTIYNAVIEIQDIEIIERHEHSRKVTYIEDGKDASVSYKTADFKFKNNLDDDIRIEAKLEENEVKIKIIKI